MTHCNFLMCSLLSVSMSRYRRTDEKNHCRRLSRVSTIIATTSRRCPRREQTSSRPRSGCTDPGVVPCPDIPEAPASPCNIIPCEPINCESKLYLESPLADCDVDYLLKNQNAEVHRMRSSGQKGYWYLPASPVTTSSSPEQRESRLFSTSRQSSSRKPKFSYSIGAGRMRREEVKARHGRLRKGYGYHQWLGPGAM